MNNTTTILENSKHNQELIGIAKYSDSNSFWCGYVLDFNALYVTLQHFTKYGKKDGILIILIDEIKYIDFNNDYTRAMQCIIDYSAELEKQSESNFSYSDSENWQYYMLSQFAGQENIVVSVELSSDDSYTGFIVKVSEDDFILICIGKDGEDLGTSIIKIEDVVGFHINDIDSRKRAMLYKWRKATL